MGQVVKQQGAQKAAAVDADQFEMAHRQVAGDSAIQFELQPYVIQPPPAWVKGLAQFFEAIFPLLKLLFWVAVGVAVVLLILAIARRVQDGRWSWPGRGPKLAESPASWRPEEAPARALLSEADSLAAQGRYAEAAHLLLFRSIEDIDNRRPNLVRPALTSRDIAGAPALPPGPKTSFSSIVMMVERSLFGGRTLGESEWRECRAAYEDFAFASAWKA
ncbi:MAG: DUF4129 domain-containing protein [Allosphingosinicella sp.]